MKGGEKIGAQDDHISADRIHNRPAPDLGLEHKIGTLCRNNSAKYPCLAILIWLQEKRKVIKKALTSANMRGL